MMKKISRHRKGRCGLIGFTAAILITIAFALTVPTSTHAATSAPVYNPETKSYFQLFDDNVNPGNWMAARNRANSKSYKGTKGRLALIESRPTHEFVLKNLKISAPTWIGLRYWCKFRKLQWETKRPFSPSETAYFAPWHSPWYRGEESACGRGGGGSNKSSATGFMAIYYRSMNGVVKWQAVDTSKFFKYYLVEFPTGEK